MRFDLNMALRAFRLTATHASFTRAAAALNVTPSALSQTVRQLERHLDVRLLHRSTRSVTLTESGRQFLDRLHPLLNELDEVMERVRDAEAQPVGRLRITLPRIAVKLILAPVLAEFMQRYPNIDMEVDVNDALVDIVGAGFDAGIRLGDALQLDCVAVPIGNKVSSSIVASPGYLAEHGQPMRPQDIQQHRCLCYRFISSGHLYRWQFAKDDQAFALLPAQTLVINDNDLRVLAAKQGMGLAYVFQEEVSEEVKAGTLVPVLADWLAAFEGFYLYYANRAHIPLRLKVFIDFLRAYEYRTD